MAQVRPPVWESRAGRDRLPANGVQQQSGQRCDPHISHADAAAISAKQVLRLGLPGVGPPLRARGAGRPGRHPLVLHEGEDRRELVVVDEVSPQRLYGRAGARCWN
jgi:hypothetical protein